MMPLRTINIFILIILAGLIFSCAARSKYSMRIEAVSDMSYDFNAPPRQCRIEVKDPHGSINTGKNEMITKNIRYLMEKELDSLGWEIDESDNAFFVFAVSFEEFWGGIGNDGLLLTEGADGNLKVESKRSGGISCFLDITVYADGEARWDASCICLDADAESAIKYMIPFLLSKFPEGGQWNRSRS